MYWIWMSVTQRTPFWPKRLKFRPSIAVWTPSLTHTRYLITECAAEREHSNLLHTHVTCVPNIATKTINNKEIILYEASVSQWATQLNSFTITSIAASNCSGSLFAINLFGCVNVNSFHLRNLFFSSEIPCRDKKNRGNASRHWTIYRFRTILIFSDRASSLNVFPDNNGKALAIHSSNFIWLFCLQFLFIGSIVRTIVT